MPDLSGMELAKQLRDVDDDLLIVLPHFILNICRKALMCSLSSFLQSLLITPLYPGCSVVFLKSLTVVPNIVVIDSEREKNFVPINEILL